MFRIFATAVLGMAVVGAAAAQAFGPAVTVGDTNIQRTKVEAQVNHLVNQRGLGSGGITQPGTYRQIQEEVVDQLVVQELLWQEARRRDFVVSDEEVNAEMQRIKNGFNSELAFQFSIEEGGFTEDTFRENIRQQRSVRRMVAEDIVPSIEITADDIETFYVEHIDEMQVPEQVRARHILVAVPADADEAALQAAEEKIRRVQAEIESGASFALTAIEESDDSSANMGGDLGYFRRGDMVPAFEEAAFALQPGEVSDVVTTDFGLHLIKVEEHVEESVVTIEQAAGKIRDYIGQQRLEEEIATLIDTLRAEYQVVVNLW